MSRAPLDKGVTRGWHFQGNASPQGEVREKRCAHGGGPEGQPGSLWATLSESEVPWVGG